MPRVLALLALLLATSAPAEAQGPRLPAAPLRLSTPQLARFLESAPPQRPGASVVNPFLERLRRAQIGIRPLFMLLPSHAPQGAETPPPTFALVARAKGRTFVSLTRPGSRLDPDERLVFQRLLISDLLRGRRFSLTVYEDHALGDTPSHLLGVGGRLTYRPSLDLAGWRLRVELFGTYDPSDGPNAYLGLSGHRQPPK